MSDGARWKLLCDTGSTALYPPPLHTHTGISWVTPTRAGIAGGTTVKIYGSGFATDAYSSSNLVYLGNIPCQVNW